MNLLENSTRNICGLCKGKPSTVDYVNDGKNGWASKASLVQVTKGLSAVTVFEFKINMFLFVSRVYLLVWMLKVIIRLYLT